MTTMNTSNDTSVGKQRKGNGFKNQVRTFLQASLSKLHISSTRRKKGRYVADVKQNVALEILDSGGPEAAGNKPKSGTGRNNQTPAPQVPPFWSGRLTAAIEAERFDEDELLDTRNIVLERHASTMGYPGNLIDQSVGSDTTRTRVRRLGSSLRRQLGKHLPRRLVSWFQRMRAKRLYRRRTRDVEPQQDEFDGFQQNVLDAARLAHFLEAGLGDSTTVSPPIVPERTCSRPLGRSSIGSSYASSDQQRNKGFYQPNSSAASSHRLTEQESAGATAILNNLDLMPTKRELRQRLHLSLSSSSSSASSSTSAAASCLSHSSSSSSSRPINKQNQSQIQNQCQRVAGRSGIFVAPKAYGRSLSSNTSSHSQASEQADDSAISFKPKLPRSNVINFAQLANDDLDSYNLNSSLTTGKSSRLHATETSYMMNEDDQPLSMSSVSSYSVSKSPRLSNGISRTSGASSSSSASMSASSSLSSPPGLKSARSSARRAPVTSNGLLRSLSGLNHLAHKTNSAASITANQRRSFYNNSIDFGQVTKTFLGDMSESSRKQSPMQTRAAYSGRMGHHCRVEHTSVPRSTTYNAGFSNVNNQERLDVDQLHRASEATRLSFFQEQQNHLNQSGNQQQHYNQYQQQFFKEQHHKAASLMQQRRSLQFHPSHSSNNNNNNQGYLYPEISQNLSYPDQCINSDRNRQIHRDNSVPSAKTLHCQFRPTDLMLNNHLQDTQIQSSVNKNYNIKPSDETLEVTMRKQQQMPTKHRSKRICLAEAIGSRQQFENLTDERPKRRKCSINDFPDSENVTKMKEPLGLAKQARRSSLDTSQLKQAPVLLVNNLELSPPVRGTSNQRRPNEIAFELHPADYDTYQDQGFDEIFLEPRIILQASTTELMNCLSVFLLLKCSKLRPCQTSQAVNWLQGVDRTLIVQGWQEIAFINPANIVFLYMLLRKLIHEDIDHEHELQTIIMTSLYLSYAYMGNEISYPLQPFLCEQDSHEEFWDRTLNIINSMSSQMLLLNSDPCFFAEVFAELKNYQFLVAQFDSISTANDDLNNTQSQAYSAIQTIPRNISYKYQLNEVNGDSSYTESLTSKLNEYHYSDNMHSNNNHLQQQNFRLGVEDRLQTSMNSREYFTEKRTKVLKESNAEIHCKNY